MERSPNEGKVGQWPVRERVERVEHKKRVTNHEFVTLLKSSWVMTDSNRRPSACKADALNQLS